jgi:heptaprenyl diphosphate synthase
MNKFWDAYPVIKSELYSVREIMEKNFKCNDKIIEQSLLELMHSGGKMLRPAFLILGGKFGNYDEEKLRSLAAVIEMLHMATLIHDDVVDNAKLRRGKETVQAKYGKNYAVYMGDFLFCKCFMLLSNNTSMENMRSISKVIATICKGEIEQFSSQYSTDVSVKQYLRRIGAKTAALFSLSLYIGAHESGCPKKLCNRLGKIGYNIGMAFQIIDDILDCKGQEKVIGKPVGSDLRQGIFTLPVIYALQLDREALMPILSKKSYSDEEVISIIEVIRKLGTIDRARDLAKRYTQKAFKEISNLPDCESKSIIKEIAEKLLIREY